jgi:hypothetical protein
MRRKRWYRARTCIGHDSRPQPKFQASQKKEGCEGSVQWSAYKMECHDRSWQLSLPVGTSIIVERAFKPCGNNRNFNSPSALKTVFSKSLFRYDAEGHAGRIDWMNICLTSKQHNKLEFFYENRQLSTHAHARVVVLTIKPSPLDE